MDCSTPAVQIPGVAGANAYTAVTTNFTVPAINANVQIQVSQTATFVSSQNILIAGPANFQIVSIDNPNQITAKFLGLAGDVASATVISVGAKVTPTGVPGAAGTNGSSSFTTTTSNFTVPSVGSTVVVPVVATAGFVIGENVIATGPANFVVTAIGGSTSITLKFLGNTGDVAVGATVTSGATLTAAGNGVNAFTTNTAQFTIPAVGSTVTVAVVNSAWMVTGQKVVFAGPATFTVTTISSAISVVLTFLGYIGDLAPTNTIANGTTVSPAGVQAPIGSTIATYGAGTAYTLTGTPSAVVLGTTSPSITLTKAGTYILWGTAILASKGVTLAAPAALTTLLQRTNNTTTPVANSSVTTNYTGAQPADDQIRLGPVVYTTANTNDIIALYSSISSTTGSPTISTGSVFAMQIA